MKIEIRTTGLRAMRESRGLTQEALADVLGMSPDWLVALESGTVKPGRPLRHVLIAYFDCRFEELFQVEMVNPEQ